MRNEGVVTYFDYTIHQESPILYHLFVAISLACACMGRRAWIAPAPDGFDGEPIYPNSYIVLVGPSGKVKKSSAIRMGVSLTKTLPNLSIIQDKLTPQYLLKFLSETADAYVVASELKTFIGTDAFINGLAAILTNLHDAPEVAEYRTKGSGVYQLVTPCVNIIGGSTPEWLVTGTPADATSGGFSARFLYVVQESTERVISFVYKDPKLIRRLEELLMSIIELSGEIPLAPGTWDMYDLWYKMNTQEVNSVGDVRTLSYYSRKHTHIWKVAMALMALRGGRELTQDDLSAADQVLRWAEITLPLAFRSITYSTSTRLLDTILEKLGHAGGTMPRRELILSMVLYGDSTEIDVAISTLRQAGLIGVNSTQDGAVYQLLKPIEDIIRKPPSEETIYNFFYGGDQHASS